MASGVAATICTPWLCSQASVSSEDAYKMSVQDNEHAVRVSGERAMIWECRVEPSPFYADTFRGIVSGTLKSHGVLGGRVETISRVADGPEHARWVFRISW